MYERNDRPTTKRIAITAAIAAVAIVVLIVASSFALGALLKPETRAPVAESTSATTAVARQVTSETAASRQATASAEPAAEQPAVATASAPPAATHAAAVPPVVAKPAPFTAPTGVVVIDAGHQGKGDPSLEPIGPGASEMKAKVTDGGSGQYAPHAESEINLAVAKKVQAQLEAHNVKVIMVRTSEDVNIANSQRAKIANDAHAALFIRLHCDDAEGSSAHGISTLVPGSNKWTAPIVAESAKAGKIIHERVLQVTGAADRGVVDRGDLSGFNWSKVPTVLVEMGFLSNPAEDKQLTNPVYQQKLAVGIAAGAVRYLMQSQ
jgi:N-acetylmuramoyl-L-alanine amidase